MLHTIIGYMNSGKTLLMSLLGYMEYKKGRDIYSNYPLSFPHKEINKDYLEMLGTTQPDLYNTTFLIDEGWIWFDCRKSMKNTIFTNFVLQSSKQDTNIYLTSQSNQQNDSRIRENQHLISVCKRKLIINGKLKDFNNLTRILPKELQEQLYINFTTYEYKLIRFEKVLRKKYRGNIKAKPLFKLYDTHNKIKHEE